MRRVPISDVKVGDILATEVFDLKGRVLLKKGMFLTIIILEKLKNIMFNQYI